jgi:hypothetical protein
MKFCLVRYDVFYSFSRLGVHYALYVSLLCNIDKLSDFVSELIEFTLTVQFNYDNLSEIVKDPQSPNYTRIKDDLEKEVSFLYVVGGVFCFVLFCFVLFCFVLFFCFVCLFVCFCIFFMNYKSLKFFFVLCS